MARVRWVFRQFVIEHVRGMHVGDEYLLRWVLHKRKRFKRLGGSPY